MLFCHGCTIIFFYLKFVRSESHSTQSDPLIDFNQTRRVLQGNKVGDTRPYMVYLRPAPTADPKTTEFNWLCGGVIIHKRFVLTSAACIEDAQHFYVISGTHRWVPTSEKSNECVKNGAKKAVWKCVPKSYVFDAYDFDNIRWMANDIAVVKVEDDFNFQRRILGCDFVPKMVAYNNISQDLEKSNSIASVAGWGSQDAFVDAVRSTQNSPDLLESEVKLISKRKCKDRWPERYHHIIDDHVICGRGSPIDTMSALCNEQVNCKELEYVDDSKEEEETRRVLITDPETLVVSSGRHGNGSARRTENLGGICENDHGGPLVVGHGQSAVVVGVTSAFLTRDNSKQCFGPFLFTSVWNNRVLINCAIHKETDPTCRRLLNSEKNQPLETHFSWAAHPDGPAKSNAENIRNKMNIPTQNINIFHFRNEKASFINQNPTNSYMGVNL